VVFGTYQAQDHPRVRVLAEGIAAHGFDVSEINEPLGLSTADRVRLLRQPWRLPVLATRLIRCWWRLWRRGRAVRGEVDAVLVGYLGHFDVHLARRTFPGVPILLDHMIFAAGTAADRGVQPGLRTRMLSRLDRSALQAADVIVIDTEEHAAQVPTALTDRTVICPVGADSSWFAAGGARPGRPAGRPLRVVFYGLYTPLQGTPTIGDALRLLADRNDIEVTMVGRGQDYQAVRRLVPLTAPVSWIDWLPAAELPILVAAHDVALGIFGTTRKAADVVPNKVYQGAAAGCALVTSDTPAQRRVLGDSVVYVPVGNGTALAAELVRLATDPAHVRRFQGAARTLADQNFTAEHIAAPLAERITTCRTRHQLHP